MWRWRRVAVARVFALVVRCRIMLLLVYSRVGKNRDTKRESPVGAGAACAASHRTVLFSQKILAAQKPMTYTDLLAVDFYSITIGGVYTGLSPLGGKGRSGRSNESDLVTKLMNSCFLFSVMGSIAVFVPFPNKSIE